jgi:dCMP deaminase
VWTHRSLSVTPGNRSAQHAFLGFTIILTASRSEERSLEGFLQENDELVFGHSTDGRFGQTSLRSFQDLVDIHINNNFNELSDFHTYLENLNLLDPQHLRPSWDAYFMVRIFSRIRKIIGLSRD